MTAASSTPSQKHQRHLPGYLRRYRQPLTRRESLRRANKKYRRSQKGKAANARYAASAKRKAVRRRYAASLKGKMADARYAASVKGKAMRARYAASAKGQKAARRRNEKYRQSQKGKAAARRGREKLRTSRMRKMVQDWIAGTYPPWRNRPMDRHHAKRIWQVLADRYGTGTLGQIQHIIQRGLARFGSETLDRQIQLLRDESRCNRAIAAIGGEYPRKLKPARRSVGGTASTRL